MKFIQKLMVVNFRFFGKEIVFLPYSLNSTPDLEWLSILRFKINVLKKYTIYQKVSAFRVLS